MFRTDLRPGEAVSIDGRITVRVEAKTGQIVRLAIEADRSIPIRKLAQPSTPHMARSLGKLE